MASARRKLYDVALSFAGEDRPYVRLVAQFLHGQGVRVFYDEYEQVRLWGKDLTEFLDEVYRLKSRFVVIFISRAYRDKDWTRHERRSALAAAIRSRRDYVLPVRFDETDLPGLPPTIAYLSARKSSALDVARIICEKLGVAISTSRPGSGPASSLEAWRIASAAWAHDLSGQGAALYGGAWNSRGHPVVYAGSSFCVALLEMLVHVEPRFLGSTLSNRVAVSLRLPPTISIRSIYESALPADWRRPESIELLRAIGTRWLESGETCILSVPSRTVPHSRYLLLNPRHPEFGSIELAGTEAVGFDWLGASGG